MATLVNQAMISEVSICNQALTWLGQEPIISLEQDNTNAEWMRENYPFLRDEMLEARMWSFTRARFTSTVEDTDPWGVQYVHPVPIEWLMVWRVYCDVRSSDPRHWIDSTGWRVESNNVLADEATVYMEGSRRITDTGKFTNGFAQALASRLAIDACMPLTEDPALLSAMVQLGAAKMDEATARDGVQGRNERLKIGSLIKQRVR